VREHRSDAEDVDGEEDAR
jgi:hypothetical protein